MVKQWQLLPITVIVIGFMGMAGCIFGAINSNKSPVVSIFTCNTCGEEVTQLGRPHLAFKKHLSDNGDSEVTICNSCFEKIRKGDIHAHDPM